VFFVFGSFTLLPPHRLTAADSPTFFFKKPSLSAQRSQSADCGLAKSHAITRMIVVEMTFNKSHD
jgi:hypothetical protein